MPAKSKAQFRYIQGLKAKYKNKANTPKTHKWIWDKEWTEDVNYKSLPDKVDEKDKKEFKGDIQIISYIDTYEVLEVLVNGKKYTIDYVSRKLYDQLNKEKDSYHRFLLLNKYYPEIINKDILKESIESIQDYFYQFATDEEKKKWESNNRTGQLPIQSEFEKVKGNRVNLIRGIDAPLITIGTMTEKDKEEDEDIEDGDSGGDMGESIINEANEFTQSMFRTLDEVFQNITDCINNLETSPKETKVVLLQTKALFNGMTNNILTECNANIAKLNKDNNQQKIEDEPIEEE